MRTRPTALLGVAMILALAACGGGNASVTLPTADGSRTGPVRPSVTVSLPSRSPSKAPTTAPTSGPTAAPTSAAPTSSAPTSPASSPTASTSTTPPAEQNTDQSEPADDSGVPSWVWWALAAAALVAAALAAFLVPRARKRSAWRAELAEAEGEVGWFARQLLPQLQ